MSKKKDKTPREIIIGTLKEQKDFVEQMLGAYDKFSKDAGFQAFPFIVIANKNLKMVLEKQIELVSEEK